MQRVLYGVFWIGVYLILVLTPLFLLLVGEVPPGRGFWRELSVALGFAGLAMMGLQFLLTARYKFITAPYGIDVIYHFHRQISVVAFLLILAHPVILFITSPGTLVLLNVFTAPWRARFGVFGLIVLLLLIITSLKRINLRINYEPWRISHGLLATAAVVLAMAHVIGVGYYIGTPGKRAFWLLLTALWVGSLLYIRVVKPVMMLRRPYVVTDIIPERGESWTLVLKPNGHKGLKFQPGQFAWLTIWSSPLSIKEHPFSFSSSAMKNSEFSLTIKELGDFTREIKKVTPGTRAYLDGPYGDFSIDRYVGPGYVFISGGVGITPVMSMLRTMADRHDRRPVLLIYGSKTWDGVTFRDEIDALKEQLNLQVVHVLEQAPPDWQGETGFVTANMLARYLPRERMELQYFLCGPEPMMNAVEAALGQLGISLEQSHAERFNLV